MAKLFQVTVTVPQPAPRTINVIAETPEEAQTKVPLVEGEAVVNVEDRGDVTV